MGFKQSLNQTLSERRFQIAFAIGVVFWLLVGTAPGVGHGAVYWFPGYLLLFVAAAIMGWFFPGKPWQSGRDIGIGELVTMLIIGLFGNTLFELLPMGVLFLIALTLPLIFANWMGAYARINAPKK